jgi:murein DD-endopeptidase MepM/ murein hydrolase activator NlpD
LQGKFRVTTDFAASIGSIRYPAIGLGTEVGTPIIAGGNGVVMLVTQCAKCTADKPNFASQGIAYSDPRALRDPAWGFGFGNFVIVRFAYKDLPGKLRAELDRQRLTNGYAYVHYAHLSRIDVKPNDQVSVNTQIGMSGATGNVTGPLLRIEVRVSAAADEKGFSSYTVVNPRLLYDM